MSRLDSAAFRSAVAKGLGRAVFAVRDGKPGEYDDLIVESCLHDQQDSRYQDALRYPYQMRLIDLAGLERRVLRELLSGERTCTHTGDLDWIVAMLGGYARRGDETARQVLQKRSQQGDDWAQEILASTGPEGLAWLVEHVLPRLPADDDEKPISGWLPREETADETPTQRRLRAILAEKQARRNASADAPQGPKLAPRKYLDLLRASRLPPNARSDFRKRATDDEYRELVELWLTDPSGPARWVAWLLPCRPLPVPFDRIVEVRETPEGKWALHYALGRMPHPEAREYALRLLRERPISFDALDPLRSSFQPGDEAAIWAALPQFAVQDFGSRMGLILSLASLMEDYDEVDWQPFAEWIYEHAESWQRRQAVEWMAEFGTVPDAIREEGVEDAEPTIRRICEDPAAWVAGKGLEERPDEP